MNTLADYSNYPNRASGPSDRPLPNAPLLHLCFQPREEFAQWHRSQVAVHAIAHGSRARRLFLLSNHEHVGNLLELCFPNLCPHVLVAVIPGDTEATLAQLGLD